VDEATARRLAAMARAFATGKVTGVSYEDEGVLVHVTLDSGEPVDCRRMLGYGGAKAGAGYGDFWEPDTDQEVLVLLLDGDTNEAILVGPLQTLQVPTPEGAGSGKRVIVVRPGDELVVEATGDITARTTKTLRGQGAERVELANSDAALTPAADGVVTACCACVWGGTHAVDHSWGVLAEKGAEPEIGRG
jgi:hypothetical protein